MNHIPLARPWFDADDEAAVLDVLRRAWVGQGPKVAEFEERFAEFVGAKYAVAVSSCTAALHLSLLALGIGPGDEVIVPAFTWISTPNAAEYVGAKPVFCDIDLDTYNIDVSEIERRLTPRTRAIIPVHLFGLAADIDPIMAIAKKRGIAVVEDAACALGTRVGQRHVGTFGEIGCFSFHPRKSITTGEGGMLVTDDEKLYRAARRFRDIGADRDGQAAESVAEGELPDFPDLGFNYRLTDLQAALGITQLAKFPRILKGRLAIARKYDELLDASPVKAWLRRPATPAAAEHSYQAYVCRLMLPSRDGLALESWHRKRNALIQSLSNHGIATRPGTHAPHLSTLFRRRYGFTPSDFPNALEADWLTIALPLFWQLTPEDQKMVCDGLDDGWVTVPSEF